MSVHVMSWVLKESPAKLGDRLVLLAIAECANHEGTDAWPSIATICNAANMGERSVQDSLRRLVAAGGLEINYNAGPRGVNRYRIIMCTPAESAPPQNPHRCGLRRATPAESAPEPSLEPSLERSLTTFEISPARASFDDFWTAYPRHAGKRDASKAWAAAVKRADPVQIIAGASRFAADPNREDAFTAFPATWLRRDGWDEDPLPPRSRGRPDATTTKVNGYAARGRELAERQAIERGST